MWSGWSARPKEIGASDHLRYLGVAGITALISRAVSFFFHLDSYASDPPYIMLSWCSGSGNTGPPAWGPGSCQDRLDRALGLLSASPRSPSRNSNPLPSASLWDGRGRWIPLPWRSHPCEEVEAVGYARLPPPSRRP